MRVSAAHTCVALPLYGGRLRLGGLAGAQPRASRAARCCAVAVETEQAPTRAKRSRAAPRTTTTTRKKAASPAANKKLAEDVQSDSDSDSATASGFDGSDADEFAAPLNSENGILDASDVLAPDFGDLEPLAGPMLVAPGEQRERSNGAGVTVSSPTARSISQGPVLFETRPLPRVLVLHTGGTLGMDPNASFIHSSSGDGPGSDGEGAASTHLREGTGGVYRSVSQLQPGRMLSDLLTKVPELRAFANLSVRVHCNKDSCRIGPTDWLRLARTLHAARPHFDAFVVVHGTDTMAYTASALSLLLAGFRKPIILTGSQLPLAMPRSDARQNLIDSLTCATASFSPPHVHCGEVCICFGGLLLRGNRARKTNSSAYSAFSTPGYPPLATLGVDVDWNVSAMLSDQQRGVYRPRFKLNPNVMRIPIVPGCDPRQAYGDVYGRGVRGVVLEAFGVGNMPDLAQHGWIPWLRQQRKRGLQVYLASQCGAGALHPELYRSGSLALALGVQAGPQMTPEAASVKLMLCLAHPDLPLSQPIAGEL